VARAHTRALKKQDRKVAEVIGLEHDGLEYTGPEITDRMRKSKPIVAFKLIAVQQDLN